MKKFYFLWVLLFLVTGSFAQVLNESFEGATFPPEGWSAASDNKTYGWSQNDGTSHGPGNVAEGTQAAMANMYYMRKEETAFLESPAFVMTDMTTPTLSFSWQCQTEYDPNPKLEVFFSADDGASYISLTVLEADGQADEWQQVKLALPIGSETGKLKFVATSDYGNKNMFLDAVKVYEPAPMTYESTVVTHPERKVLSVGGTNLLVLDIAVQTQGAKEPLALTTLNLDFTGTTDLSDISSVSVYQAQSTEEMVAENLLGTAAVEAMQVAVSGSKSLSEGNNQFMVVVNSSSDAIEGNQVDVGCSKLMVSGTEHEVVAGAPEGQFTLKKQLNMPAGTNQVVVNEQLHFYDDGGSEGKCSEDFEGTISFIPKHNDKIIAIQWQDFDIFNTSSVGKNDIFKVYHGSSVDDQQLIGTYSEQPPLIKSMADNGAITIYFKVKTGIPRAGWNALVKEITPEPMSVTEVAPHGASEPKASAGDKLVILQSVTIETEHTATPVSLEALKLDLSETSDLNDISKLAVYYTGTIGEFSTDNCIGTAATIDTAPTFSVNQQLTHGKNYFWVVADVNVIAVDKHLLGVNLSGVTVAGKDYQPTTQVSGKVTLDNTYYMPREGVCDKTVYQLFDFVDDGGVNSNYDNKSNGTVTFLPASANEKVKLNFSKFNVLFQSSSYGTKAIFRVYSGRSTSSANLIWEADETNCDQGPGHIITSTAEDGALTIHFVGNAYSSSQTKAGWQGQIWSAVPKPMEIASVDLHGATESVQPGTGAVEMLKVCVNTEGTLSPVDALEVFFDLGETTDVADVKTASVYFGGLNNNFADAQPFGAPIANPGSAFSVSADVALQEGTNYFWLLYDIAPEANVGDKLDAGITKVVSAAQTVVPEVTNPEGVREIKKMLNLLAGTNEVIVNETPTLFYDDGGIAGNYSKDFEGIVVFRPESPEMRVRIDLSSLEICNTDVFEVYLGEKTDDVDPIIAWDDDDNFTIEQEARFVKSIENGQALTVRFKTSKYTSSPTSGWTAQVQAFTPQAVSYNNAAVKQITDKVLRGQNDAAVLSGDLKFKGELTSASLQSMTFSTVGSLEAGNIVSAAVYFSSESMTEFDLQSAELFGQVVVNPDGTFTFTGEKSFTAEGGYKFWLVYTIAEDANIGAWVDARLLNVKVNNKQYTVENGNPTGKCDIVAGLKGLFTLGGDDADFDSFAELASALTNQGIEGPVTVHVTPDVYVELAEFKHIQGASQQHPIVIKGTGATAKETKLVYKRYNDPGYGAPEQGILSIAGADWITFENLYITTTNCSYDAAIVVRDVSRHVTIENCVVEVPMGMYYSDACAILSKAENQENCNNDYLTIQNSKIIGGRNGVSLSGTGFIKLPKEVGLRVSNNIFQNQGSKGMWLNSQADAKIVNNLILNNATTKSGFQGLDCYRINGQSIIANNQIILDVPVKVVGLEMRPIIGSKDGHALVYNNVINIKQATGLSTGVCFDDGCANLDLLYNSIVLNGEGANSRGIAFLGGTKDMPSDIEVRYNLIQNKANGVVARINSDTFWSGIRFDNNVLYSSGTCLAKEGSVELTDLVAWQEKAGAQNSVVLEAQFYADTDLHIKSAEGLSIAKIVPGIEKDIEGADRDLDSPVAGAYAFGELSTTAPVFTEGYPCFDKITWMDATFSVEVDKAGRAWYVVLPETAGEPTADQVIAGQDSEGNDLAEEVKGMMTLYKERALDAKVAKLAAHKKYVLYLLTADNLGNQSETVISVPFTTDFLPTQPATFELIKEGSTNFDDGTATFSNGRVVTGAGALGSAQYLEAPAATHVVVNLTNTEKGLVLDGAFFKNTAVVKVQGVRDEGTKTDILEIAPQEEWQFISFRHLGEVTDLEIWSDEAGFAMDDFSGIPAPITLDLDDVEINQGEQATLSVTVTGGVGPFTYSWDGVPENQTTELNVSPVGSCEYSVTVTDAFGQEKSAKAYVQVNAAQAAMADFERLSLNPESYWQGEENQKFNWFYSGSFKFNNYYKPEWATWGNFAYSNETSNTFDPIKYLEHQFRSAAGGDITRAGNYGVVYAFGNQPVVELTNSKQGEVLKGVYLTNTSYAVSSMKNGDSFVGEGFKQGDYYKVIVTGVDADGDDTQSIDIYLADYRSSNPEEHYILETWKWFDLSSLGAVKKLRFVVDGSRYNQNGLTIPGYFCMDNLNGSKIEQAPYATRQLEKLTVSEDASDEDIDLVGLFTDPDSDDAGIEIAVSEISNDKLVQAQVVDNKLRISFVADAFGDTQVTLTATSADQSATATLEVSITPVDDAPYELAPLATLELDAGTTAKSISLTGVFDDIDSDVADFVYSVVSVSDKHITATIEKDELVVSAQEEAEGSYQIEFQVELNGLTAQSTLQVDIKDATDIENMAAAMKLYPNPCVDELFLQFANPTDGKVTVYSTLGTRVWSADFYHQVKQALPAEDWKNGVYFVKVQLTNGKTKTYKILKN